MIRQYRIERFQGMEILVCECFRKHTWTQSENDALFRYNEECRQLAGTTFSQDEFKVALNEFLEDPSNDGEDFYGLSEPIPTFDSFPCLVLRGPVVDNRIASLQVDYVGSMLVPEIVEEIGEFYSFVESRHWRNFIAHQLEKYGSLF